LHCKFNVLSGYGVGLSFGFRKFHAIELKCYSLYFRRHKFKPTYIDYLVGSASNFVVAITFLNDIAGVVPTLIIERTVGIQIT